MKIKELLYLIGGLAIGFFIATSVFNDDSDSPSLSAEDVRAIVAEENDLTVAAILEAGGSVESALTAEDVSTIVAEENDLVVRALLQLSERVSNIEETLPQERDVDPLGYYTISYDEVVSWLTSTGIDASAEDADLTANLVSVSSISSATDLVIYFDGEAEAVDNVLATVYTALEEQLLAGASGDATAETKLNVCLAVNDNPYDPEQSGLFIYVEVSETLINKMPKTADGSENWEGGETGETEWQGWTALDTQKENSMTWSAECYTPTDTE